MVTIKSLVQFCNEDGSHVVEIKKKVDKEKVLTMHETDVKVWKEMEVALWARSRLCLMADCIRDPASVSLSSNSCLSHLMQYVI